MENIYSLSARLNDLSRQYDELSEVLNAEYEENGGEITDSTEEKEARKEDLVNMRNEILSEVLSLPDEYAALVKNEEANKKILEAELKAIIDEQKKVVDKYKARINRMSNKISWFKDNIAEAMKLANIEKIGGAKTQNKFTIFFKNTASIETDEQTLLQPYLKQLKELEEELPQWLILTPKIVKSGMDRNDLPEGAVLNETKNLQIK